MYSKLGSEAADTNYHRQRAELLISYACVTTLSTNRLKPLGNKLRSPPAKKRETTRLLCPRVHINRELAPRASRAKLRQRDMSAAEGTRRENHRPDRDTR